MAYTKLNRSAATLTKNRTEGSVSPFSGMCVTCVDGCIGMCEIGKSAYRGPEVLYPQPFGIITAASEKDYPVDLSHFTILGTAVGAVGVEADSDVATFEKVDVETAIGVDKSLKLKLPFVIPGMGSTNVAKQNWEGLAKGAAISGVILTVGENVCAMDDESEIKNGRIVRSPDMENRVGFYKEWQDGYGTVAIQSNVEDTRFGVAEYVSSKHDLDTIELKWGQGAKCIGGEIKVKTLERAAELKRRGYIVSPDPTLHENQMAYKEGALKDFERHSRLGFVTKEAFLEEVDRLRGLGFKRITLKTGAYSALELAMALRYGAEAKLDLLTIDGAPGGTGMSPWPMMNEWGIPTFYLQALTYKYCEKLSRKGVKVPDIAMAGGFSTEDGVFKALAMGSPYVKAVCMGRGLMIPGMVGKNIGVWLKEGKLPRSVSKYGNEVREIFVAYAELEEKFGSEMKNIPLGAVGIYTYCQKFRVGLQQLMAGSRNFRLSTISRKDLMALTEEASKISGIPYVMNAYSEEANKVLEE